MAINDYQLAIIDVVRYFSFFDYSPIEDEIYVFLKSKVSRVKFKRFLNEAIKKGFIKAYFNNKNSKMNLVENLKLKIENSPRYTVGEYSKQVKSDLPEMLRKAMQAGKLKAKSFQIISKRTELVKKKWQISKEKIRKIELYIKLLSLFPQIKLVGLSGSVAMMNANMNDDIDLFVITAKNRLFTGRFIAVALAQLLGLKRPRVNNEIKDKVCLNLFFDETNLQVPKNKRTEYVAHEILQMKPLINKDKIYERFLDANSWVLKIFPNASCMSFRAQPRNPFLTVYRKGSLRAAYNLGRDDNFFIRIEDYLEQLFKKIQLFFISRHKTNEIITDSQLWFHPVDFGKKIYLTPNGNRVGC